MPSTPFTWRIVGACVTGTRHLRSEECCEDVLGQDQLPDGTLLLAVADGAGSATRGKEGADCVIQEALIWARTSIMSNHKLTDESFYLTVLENILYAARQAIEARARGGASLHDFATTLLCTLVTPQWLAVVQVGDGAIVVQHVDGTIQTLTRPDHGEYINECSFITDDDYQEHAQYVILPLENIRGIAMFTDGLQMLALELATNIAYSPFFTPLFSFASQKGADEAELSRELQDFLASERVCERTDDDKTLVLAVSLL